MPRFRSSRRLEDSIPGPAVASLSQIGVEIRTGDNLWAWDGCRGCDWWENASLVAPRHVDPLGIRRQWGELERIGEDRGQVKALSSPGLE